MNIPKVTKIPILFILFGSICGVQVCPAQQYFQSGDINYDGWCNMADLNVLVGMFAGTCDSLGLCMAGADGNGDGTVNGLDLAYFTAFFNGGPAPLGVCPTVTKTCNPAEQAEIWLLPVINPDSDQATFSVYVEASTDIGALNFSYKYDPLRIASFSTANHANVHNVKVLDRAFTGGDNICAFLVQCADNGFGQSYPMGIGGTRIFDIIIDRQHGTPSPLLRIVEDPYHGPPYFYFGMGADCAGEDVICPFVPIIYPCDANNNGNCNGLDVTYLVSYFKGGSQAPGAEYFYDVPVSWNH
jgi:hypothetical protein